ncbi:MAG: DUF4389 domain-containing protein [Chloroflexi bacterium]|nr:DUF4389 domain-containing protein [Chloroflexota bacterium]MCI0818470.1 DUF4389 domain-containing protein [Chloroflexota bacterium]MCI0820313.1 DUF4389 domain-containing protein [Chloroflexota bacterium]MCI0832614.1 DUF4389 domain-containing protein [Chloroflexota bacterium]MCI0839727.1 DUF4389 domain-containing protein [Chloroflexota bacterium]
MTAEPTAAPASGYPTQFDVEYPEELSRLLIFVKLLLAIPHLFILYALGVVQSVITIIALFAILFTTRYPEGLFKISVGVLRWQANVSAYILLLRDEYPPFSWDAGEYPLALEVEYPDTLNRWLPLVKWLLAIPNAIVLAILGFVAYILVFFAWFAILFTGKFPRGLFDFIVGTQRWTLRLNAYIYLMRDEYPPFSLK